jgi:hypothetical protein
LVLHNHLLPEGLRLLWTFSTGKDSRPTCRTPAPCSESSVEPRAHEALLNVHID